MVNRIQAIIFDYGGTIDTNALHWSEVLWEGYRHTNIPVSKEEFRTMVFTAATMAHRRVAILHQLTQPADHPINIYHPEGEYLKGLVLQVE